MNQPWETLKNVRESKGMSIKDLAGQAQIPSATICAWENDMPTWLGRFKSLCDALEISPNALLGYHSNGGDIADGRTIVKDEKREKSAFTADELHMIYRTVFDYDCKLREQLKQKRIDIEVVNEINENADLLEKIADCMQNANDAKPIAQRADVAQRYYDEFGFPLNDDDDDVGNDLEKDIRLRILESRFH